MKKNVFSRLLISLLMVTVLLGIHNGRVALWENDDPQPSRIFPYRAEMLPADARRMLEKGIRVESMEELDRLLEAYLS